MKDVILIGCIAFAALTAPCAEKPGLATTDLGGGFSGKVVETMNTAGYTYVLVDTGAKKKWAAAPAFPVKVNDTVTVAEPMAMTDYHSKTLNRDFDVVYFTAGISVNGAKVGGAMPNLPKDHPPIDGVPSGTGGMMPALPKDHPPIAGSTPPAVDFTSLAKAAGGMTIAEVYAAKAKLNGQTAKVRGRVVKFNAEILGKNWLHIRDGSGSEGSNDLLVTTSTVAKIGDKVLVSGKLATDKDFGSGYKYPLMLEDAKVTVE